MFTNAAPGPRQPGTCLTGTSPTGVAYVSLSFDNQTSGGAAADHSLGGNQNISPNNNDYDCSATAPDGSIGRIAWNHSTQILTVNGNVFFDSNVATQSNLRYDTGTSKQATITTTGTFTPAGNVCGAETGAACSTTTWDPSANQLTIVAGNCAPTACNSVSHDITVSAALTLQGLFWTDGGFQTNNSATFQGSVIAKNSLNMTGSSGAPALGVPSGPPGISGGYRYALSYLDGSSLG